MATEKCKESAWSETMNYRMLGMLSAGHLVNDFNQGAIPALLPFFIAKHGLSYAAAAGIVFFFTISSTLIQPLFGHLADRSSKTWIIPAGVFLAGSGLALTGLAPNYSFLVLLVLFSGVGSAAFHPEAARYVNFAGGGQKATAMSLFGVGGTLGFASGPLVITSVVLLWGLKGTLIVFIPAGITALLILFQSSRLTTLERVEKTRVLNGPSTLNKDNWGAFGRLSLTIIGKSVLFYGLITFIPLYWVKVLGQSEAAGAAALSLFLVSGVLGNLLGGWLADRFGRVRVIIIGCALLIPSLPALVWASNVHMLTLLLVPVGSFLSMTYSPTIVMGQTYLPNHIGLSSGMTLGVAFSIGGMTAPLLGMVADYHGIWYALVSIAFIPVLITGIACTLPSQESKTLSAAK